MYIPPSCGRGVAIDSVGLDNLISVVSAAGLEVGLASSDIVFFDCRRDNAKFWFELILTTILRATAANPSDEEGPI
jgi:hypothetical protein